MLRKRLKGRTAGYTLLEVILVGLLLALIAGVIYSKVLSSRAPRISAAVVEMLNVAQAARQLVEVRGVTDLSDPDFQSDLTNLVSGRTSPVGGTYSVTVDAAADAIVVSENLSTLSAEDRSTFARNLAQRVCPDCESAADPVTCCSAVDLSGTTVTLRVVLDQ